MAQSQSWMRGTQGTPWCTCVPIQCLVTVGLRALTCLAWFGLLAAEWGGVGLQVLALPSSVLGRQGQGVCLTHCGSVFARVGQSWGGCRSDAACGGQGVGQERMPYGTSSLEGGH